MLALTSFLATTALATSPHFISCDANGVNPDGTLSVAFKIAGLGANQELTVTTSADATAVYGCLNKGQQCPNSKVAVSGVVTASGTFTSGKNGQITASLTVKPPPNTAVTCPPGGSQTLVLVSVSYTNVIVSAPGAGDCDTSPENPSANFFPQCP